MLKSVAQKSFGDNIPSNVNGGVEHIANLALKGMRRGLLTAKVLGAAAEIGVKKYQKSQEP